MAGQKTAVSRGQRHSGLPVQVIRYEDMLNRPFEVFRDFAAFGDLPADEDRLARAIEFSRFEVLQRQEQEAGFREKSPRAESFFRAGRKESWRERLTAEQVRRIVSDHGRVMQRFGYMPSTTSQQLQSKPTRRRRALGRLSTVAPKRDRGDRPGSLEGLTLVRAEEPESCDVDGEAVMLSINSGRYYGTNPVGTHIWKLLERPQTLDRLCTQLLKEFDVAPDLCRREVSAFLHDLKAEGLIAIATEAGREPSA